MKHLKDIKDWKECINEVVCGDCLELMKMIPDNAIDLCLTDPPYGINADRQQKKKWGFNEYEKTEWDSEKPSKEFFDEINRISKHQIIFGGNYFVEYLKPSMGWIVWDKKQYNFSFSDAELAYTSFQCKLRVWKYSRSATVVQEGKRFHPTQKPLELMRWCLENYAKDCKTIIDPFAGSFTTARACKDMGFDWIAIDKEEKYCEIGKKRLEQGNLF